MTEGLSVERDGAVLRLTIDRPDKRNALTDAIVAGLITELDAAQLDDSTRAVLLTGSGEHFCAGFDVADRNAGRAPKPRAGSIQRRLPQQAHRLIPALLETQVPVVAAVRGWAAGIGLHLALAADVTVAADDARLWEPFAERGFTPDSGGTWLLPRLVGVARAKDMLLLGRQVTGTEAAAWGMVHSAVSTDAVEGAAAELADRLASGPTVTLGLAKWLVHRGAGVGLDQHLPSEALALEVSSRTHDFREGLAARADRRPPDFTGR